MYPDDYDESYDDHYDDNYDDAYNEPYDDDYDEVKKMLSLIENEYGKVTYSDRKFDLPASIF